MRNKHNKPETYCLDCNMRTDGDVWPAYTNIDKFCQLGFTQNPRSLEATVNALKNNAQVCHKNPFRAQARLMMGG